MSIKDKIRLGIWLLLTFVITTASAMQMTQPPSHLRTFNNRWYWAEDQIKQNKKPAWIGYAIDQDDSMNVHRNWYDEEDYVTFAELLNKNGIDWPKSNHKTALLFCLDGNSSVIDLQVSDFDSRVKLKDHPVFWLGNVAQDASANQVVQLYQKANDPEIKKDLIFAVAIHRSSEQSLPFLKNVAKSQADEELRKTAVFWLGQYHEEALDFLIDLVQSDRSEEVRKSAIFAISQSRSDKAFDALIHIAKNNKQLELRKQAVFWLSQQENEKTSEALNGMVFDQDNVELQKHAVFSLSQLDTKESVDDLLKIVNTHPNPAIRKQAIFWLGQTDDPRALDALVGVIEKNRDHDLKD